MKDEKLTDIVGLFMKMSFLSFFITFIGWIITRGTIVERVFSTGLIASIILVAICMFFVVMGLYLTLKKGKKDGSSDDRK